MIYQLAQNLTKVYLFCNPGFQVFHLNYAKSMDGAGYIRIDGNIFCGVITKLFKVDYLQNQPQSRLGLRSVRYKLYKIL